jgi:hypothetical protein
MADTTFSVFNGLLKRLRDMGDGSHAEVVIAALGQPTVARQLAAGSASANVQLTATCTRVSIYARNADIRYALGTANTVAAAATSHFIALGERLDLWVPAGCWIAAIRAGASDGVLEISELQ